MSLLANCRPKNWSISCWKFDRFKGIQYYHGLLPKNALIPNIFIILGFDKTKRIELGSVEEYKIIAPAISTAGVYYFTTDSDINYEVRFGRRQDNILHATIVFGVTNDEYEGEEYTVTNKGELYRVMTTIVKVVKMFMFEHPKMVTYEFTGLAKESEPEDKLTSRINLYKRYLPRIFDRGEWKFDYSRGNTIIVTRIK